MSAKRHRRNNTKLPALGAWLALFGIVCGAAPQAAYAQSLASPVAEAADAIRSTPDQRAQTVRMSQLVAALSDRTLTRLTEEDISDLSVLAAGSNVPVADMATTLLGCEGARATFVLPLLERRLSENLVNPPAFYSGVQSDEYLRIAIFRIRSDKTCDKPTPDVMSRVSPVGVG